MTDSQKRYRSSIRRRLKILFFCPIFSCLRHSVSPVLASTEVEYYAQTEVWLQLYGKTVFIHCVKLG